MLAAQHIVFAGGGTAGHLFPGINVAWHLAAKYPRLKITFAGTGKPFERHAVVEAGFAYLTMPAHPFPTRARDALRFVTDNISGYYSASRFLRQQSWRWSSDWRLRQRTDVPGGRSKRCSLCAAGTECDARCTTRYLASPRCRGMH